MTTWSSKILAACLYVLPAFAAGGDVSVTASVDRSEITVGDPIAFTAEIRRKKGVVHDLPGLNVAMGGFDIRDYSSDDVTDKETGDVTTRIRYVITTYATGDYRIPPVRVAFYDSARGDTGSVSTDSIAIAVKSVAASEAEDILDIKPPAAIRGSRTVVYTIIVIAVLLVAGVLFYYLYLRKRWAGGGSLFAPKEEPPVPPHEEALGALDALDAEGLVGAGKVREHYFKASEILRRYQGRRYGCQVLERTTSEINADMERMGVAADERDLFASFHADTDMVKFASFVPADKEAGALTGRVRDIVVRTKREEGSTAAPVEERHDGTAPVDGYETDDAGDERPPVPERLAGGTDNENGEIDTK